MKNKKLISLSILLIFFITLKVINPSIIQKISFINYDFYQKVFNRGEVTDVTIIDIDEKSISKIGQFPWRRDVYSKILYNLNQYNPLAIAFDIVFSEEDKQNPKSLLLQLQNLPCFFPGIPLLFPRGPCGSLSRSWEPAVYQLQTR